MNSDRYKSYLLDTAVKLLNIDSPSGYTANVISLAEQMARELGFDTRHTGRGGLCITAEGRDNSKSLACFAHVDTVGLIIRDITDKGELLISKIGAPVLPSMEGEYCNIYTRESGCYTGTVLSLSPSYHVYADYENRLRNAENMYVRLDEIVHSFEDVKALGIDRGDFIAVNSKAVISKSGFIKSRYLDDKASVAILLTVLKKIRDEQLKPQHRTHVVFTTYEEVGQGSIWQPDGISEFLVVDMGCVGPHLGCTEEMVSVCAKDSQGPYDYDMTTRLVHLAKQNGIDYAVDVYPYYSSDAAVAWKAGCDVPGALVGAGIQASHGMERTHWLGLKNTFELILAYLDLK